MKILRFFCKRHLKRLGGNSLFKAFREKRAHIFLENLRGRSLRVALAGWLAASAAGVAAIIATWNGIVLVRDGRL